MTTAKPRYAGDEAGVTPDNFSDNLRKAIRNFYPDKNACADPSFGHPADEFVAEVLEAAWWAKSQLHDRLPEGTKAQLRAELTDLLKNAGKLEFKLRNISPDVARLLDINSDPIECADTLAHLVTSLKQAGNTIDKWPQLYRRNEMEHLVAVELAIRVLRVLATHGIRPAATADSIFGYVSDAVKILKLIGEDIKLERNELTWRDIIIEAKRSAPDLQ